ncbi:hypothetical protein ZIOFF_058204 [Zingiber officinale]|uniref:NAC domain-containing protein n=1 Tax=Zingiber officinale TaxID=94328 RepID=A0A8J5F6P8_ZINOF|nr:hypothetical protein ZIOFF_058204 [Zingiber officinale]
MYIFGSRDRVDHRFSVLLVSLYGRGVLSKMASTELSALLPQAKRVQLLEREEIGEDRRERPMDLPGFRFHPTEEELLDCYLRQIVHGRKQNFDVIGNLNIYLHDPWELPGLAKIGEREWYFFVPRDRRSGIGGRRNRTTARGFWKATGSDRPIRSAADPRRVLGVKKTLVFYRGRAARGTKTDWVMNEYRLPEAPAGDVHFKVPTTVGAQYCLLRIWMLRRRRSKRRRRRREISRSCRHRRRRRSSVVSRQTNDPPGAPGRSRERSGVLAAGGSLVDAIEEPMDGALVSMCRHPPSSPINHIN